MGSRPDGEHMVVEQPAEFWKYIMAPYQGHHTLASQEAISMSKDCDCWDSDQKLKETQEDPGQEPGTSRSSRRP
jgi:hypothetical protein